MKCTYCKKKLGKIQAWISRMPYHPNCLVRFKYDLKWEHRYKPRKKEVGK